MRTFIRFNIGEKSIKQRRIANSWGQLKDLIDNYGFPPGHMLSANRRVWFEDEIDGWLNTRPVASKDHGGNAMRVTRLRRLAEANRSIGVDILNIEAVSEPSIIRPKARVTAVRYRDEGHRIVDDVMAKGATPPAARVQRQNE